MQHTFLVYLMKFSLSHGVLRNVKRMLQSNSDSLVLVNQIEEQPHSPCFSDSIGGWETKSERFSTEDGLGSSVAFAAKISNEKTTKWRMKLFDLYLEGLG